MIFRVILLLLTACTSFLLPAQVLNLPARNTGAMNGTQFIATISSPTLSATTRENMEYTEVSNGNVPSFYRNLKPVTSSAVIGGITESVTYYVIPDYLAIGTDTNYFLCPMSPMLATQIADLTACTLPTRKMVNDIYAAATVKLVPKPIPYSPTNGMTTVPVWSNYNDTIRNERNAVAGAHPLGELTGGDKKDVVISNMIYTTANRVVIYGWHTSVGNPIQPMTNVHADTYMDYSHGIRLVQNSVMYNGNPTTVKAILQSATLNTLLSDEGSMSQPWYPYGPSNLSIPVSFAVLRASNTSLHILVTNDPLVTDYNVYVSTNGTTFSSPTLYAKASLVLTGLTPNTVYYIKLAAFDSNTGQTSGVSTLLAATTSSQPDSTLLVYGFDRSITGNTYDYVIQHGTAFHNNGKVFSSATHQAISGHLISLNNYAIADYILGEESTVNQTFSDSEQVLFASYLKQGGHLFASGSEIAWDLDHSGTATDKAFFNNYLKAAYAADSPGNQVSVYYSAYTAACPSSIYPTSDSITFDNGTHGTYNVSYPDVVSPVNGGVADVHYKTASTDLAGVHYAGVYAGGTKTGKMVYLCFPFETIYPADERDTIMSRIIRFFDGTSGTSTGEQMLTSDVSLRLFPNPVEGNAFIEFTIPNAERVKVDIYDVTGRIIQSLSDQSYTEGVHQLTVSSSGWRSGVYFVSVRTDSFSKRVPFIVQ
jgi:hypothetical protein